ncbi:hypothetical protein DFH05DRAFT_1464630 [Lentinula detonsa]|uniref:Uncharacterized protein n=1 Tax=Lentinula detonsa TaxID=2804962 RepID=A0A9W8NPT4_9AGAR|nr:hypothetical protein DFH05DRAFT_1464679 [Lentinula detonsa]KAJ3738383.1 hypothetical protein DFH05DRAFT_1464659 [Lentinula detonsa]KAJ3738389.1 hypothetical protein DFH05DRAFT_1464656 [Lentinula detonsa]KAJ3738394.1 hypothetical protein DFH05DRAFT_1464653 [Lentinula detonsa]KAJ3738401.1 hypothetical protein DFH05DRAFT_1464650 [Lentinula detonsa]
MSSLFSVPTRIFVVVAPINVLLNYILVWGPSATRLGFIGAPITTSIFYYLLSLSYIIYGVFWADRKTWQATFRAYLDGGIWTILELWAWYIVALVASQDHLRWGSLLLYVYFLGERDTLRAGAAAKGAVAVGFAIAGLMSVLLLAFRNSFACLFNNDRDPAKKGVAPGYRN